MKTRQFILVILLLISYTTAKAQGDTYSNSIPLTMDGVIRNFASSSGTGDNVLCTANGTTSVTWFSLTTNSSGHCPLVNITAADGLACEVAMYTSISGNINNNFESSSSMCFDDGTGLWAPAETFAVSAGKTYYLRIKTQTPCTLSIGAQHRHPDNDDCTGATSIGTIPITDNNACHLPGPGVSPDQLCAFTLENTAFYQFYVATDGNSIINVTNISCDNGAINNSSGFQIGFFTGNCPFLNPLSCTSGSGNFVQATSPPLAAGTRVYVAIDGNGGSNCIYSISGINVTGVLEHGISNFSVWESGSMNKLSWKTNPGFSGRTIFIERSVDGARFEEIGEVMVANTGEEFYQFDDHSPLERSFYRLKVVSANNHREYSVTREIRRSRQSFFDIRFQNPVTDRFNGIINSAKNGNAEIMFITSGGQIMWKAMIPCRTGVNHFNKDITSLPAGQYFIKIRFGDEQFTRPFIYAK